MLRGGTLLDRFIEMENENKELKIKLQSTKDKMDYLREKNSEKMKKIIEQKVQISKLEALLANKPTVRTINHKRLSHKTKRQILGMLHPDSEHGNEELFKKISHILEDQ